ncbi:MAG: hypothetical protein H0U87_02235 [Acidobacteria bacterium]|nr:hypothetical protein [Acidobacteriota bacterium]
MLENLLEPNYPRAALGIERENLTALALQREKGQRFGIKQAATVELPEHLLTPNFIGQNINSPAEMVALLEEVVTNAGLRNQKRWSVSLPSTAARAAILTLESEPASRDELAQILDWKAENTFGIPAGEMRITRRKIASDAATGRARYFATAVKLSVIDEYETVFERLDWQAGLVLPRAVSEARWLYDKDKRAAGDSLLISSQNDGFVALVMRGGEPTVVRSVTCTESERDDEIYRLLMFYRDRLGGGATTAAVENSLEKLLVVGKELNHEHLRDITNEALGAPLDILQAADVGLNIPNDALNFDEVAAPAGLAALGWK